MNTNSTTKPKIKNQKDLIPQIGTTNYTSIYKKRNEFSPKANLNTKTKSIITSVFPKTTTINNFRASTPRSFLR